MTKRLRRDVDSFVKKNYSSKNGGSYRFLCSEAALIDLVESFEEENEHGVVIRVGFYNKNETERTWFDKKDLSNVQINKVTIYITLNVPLNRQRIAMSNKKSDQRLEFNLSGISDEIQAEDIRNAFIKVLVFLTDRTEEDSSQIESSLSLILPILSKNSHHKKNPLKYIILNRIEADPRLGPFLSSFNNNNEEEPQYTAEDGEDDNSDIASYLIGNHLSLSGGTDIISEFDLSSVAPADGFGEEESYSQRRSREKFQQQAADSVDLRDIRQRCSHFIGRTEQMDRAISENAANNIINEFVSELFLFIRENTAELAHICPRDILKLLSWLGSFCYLISDYLKTVACFQEALEVVKESINQQNPIFNIEVHERVAYLLLLADKCEDGKQWNATAMKTLEDLDATTSSNIGAGKRYVIRIQLLITQAELHIRAGKELDLATSRISEARILCNVSNYPASLSPELRYQLECFKSKCQSIQGQIYMRNCKYDLAKAHFVDEMKWLKSKSAMPGIETTVRLEMCYRRIGDTLINLHDLTNARINVDKGYELWIKQSFVTDSTGQVRQEYQREHAKYLARKADILLLTGKLVEGLQMHLQALKIREIFHASAGDDTSHSLHSEVIASHCRVAHGYSVLGYASQSEKHFHATIKQPKEPLSNIYMELMQESCPAFKAILALRICDPLPETTYQKEELLRELLNEYLTVIQEKPDAQSYESRASHLLFARTLQRVGDIARIVGDYDTASRKLNLALEKQIAIDSEPAVAASYDLLGKLSFRQGDFETASRHFNDAYLIRKKCFREYQTSHPDVAASLVYIAAVHLVNGQPLECLRLLRGRSSGDVDLIDGENDIYAVAIYRKAFSGWSQALPQPVELSTATGGSELFEGKHHKVIELLLQLIKKIELPASLGASNLHVIACALLGLPREALYLV